MHARLHYRLKGCTAQDGTTTNDPSTVIFSLMPSACLWDLSKPLCWSGKKDLIMIKKQNRKVIIFNNIKNKRKTNKEEGEESKK